MARIVQNDDTFTIDSPPLQLVFTRAGDRWSHAVELAGERIASGVEFDPDRDDPDRPVSPAYQQLIGQELPGIAQALLVGQWGHHHGSAVFSVLEAGPGRVGRGRCRRPQPDPVRSAGGDLPSFR